jgi:DNA-binding FrmR family transcriptional regulator
MSPEANEKILRRLRSAEGHLRAVIQMLEQDAPCEQVLHQLGAVQAALRAVGSLLVDENLQASKAVICRAESPEDRAQALERLVALYQIMNT